MAKIEKKITLKVRGTRTVNKTEDFEEEVVLTKDEYIEYLEQKGDTWAANDFLNERLDAADEDNDEFEITEVVKQDEAGWDDIDVTPGC